METWSACLAGTADYDSCIVDYSAEQTQMQTLRAAGLKRPYAMDWIRATTATKDATISDANLAAIMGGMLVFRDPIGIGLGRDEHGDVLP